MQQCIYFLQGPLTKRLSAVRLSKLSTEDHVLQYNQTVRSSSYVSDLFYVLTSQGLRHLAHRSVSNARLRECHWLQSSCPRRYSSMALICVLGMAFSDKSRVCTLLSSVKHHSNQNIRLHDLKSIAVDGAARRFALNDAAGCFGAVFDGGPAGDTPRPWQLPYLSKRCHLCKIFHTYA